MEATIGKSESKAKVIGFWALKIAIGGIFLMAGASKISGAEQMVQMFEAIGVGQWFRYVTGLTEVAGAILILIPATAGLGALLTTCTMVGAIITHLFVIGGNPAMPIGLLAGSLFILYVRREQFAKILGR